MQLETTDQRIENNSKQRSVKECKTPKKNAFDSIVEHLRLNGIKLRRNEISREIERDGELQSEQALNSLFITLNTGGCEATLRDWNVYINSQHIESYNPIVEYFNSLGEDSSCWGTIEKLAACLTLDPAQGLPIAVAKTFITRWLVGVVASVYGDWYNSIFLILCGPKGCGKTEFFRRLLPMPLMRFLAESKLTSGKDDEMLCAKALLLLVDEMDTLNKRDAAEIRRFLSTNIFTFRPPYAKAPVSSKRLASLCGASNESQVIVDAQNNRRIVPICIKSVNHELYNSIDKEQLFKETLFLLKNGEEWHLTPSEIAELDQYTGINAVLDVEQEMIEKYYVKDAESYLTSTEIAADLQHRTTIRLSPTKVGKALSTAGFLRVSKKVDGIPKYVWNARSIDGSKVVSG